eukprot:g27066.t1
MALAEGDATAWAGVCSKLVSHYLDHIQPAIDQLAARECHYFADLDPTVLPEDGAFGEHRLERMQSFLQFQDLVAHAVDQWCRQANVGEDLLHQALKEAAAQTQADQETNGTILLELLASADDFGTFAAYMAGEAKSSLRGGYAGS